MADNKVLVGGLIAVIFLVLGTVYFYPYFIGTDYCYADGKYGLWETTGEHIFYNDTFTSIGRYHCSLEANISKEDCAVLDRRLNIDGCKWGGKTSTSKKMLYVMEDPELILEGVETISSIDTEIAVDVGLDKGQGIAIDLVEDGLTHKVLEITIDRDITAQDISLLLTENNVEATRGQLTKRNVTTESYWTYRTECTEKEVTDAKNGTSYTDRTCVQVPDRLLTREVIGWLPIALKSEQKLSIEKMEVFPIISKGTYRYSFDVPIIKTERGWGNAGTIYLKLDDTLFVDKQHSSWWNTSFAYRVSINVSAPDKNRINEPVWINQTSLTISAPNLNNQCTSCIAVTDENNNKLRFEIINKYSVFGNDTDSVFNSSDYLVVALNSTAGTQTKIWVYYGNSSAIPNQQTDIVFWYDRFDTNTTDKYWWYNANAKYLTAGGVGGSNYVSVNLTSGTGGLIIANGVNKTSNNYKIFSSVKAAYNARAGGLGGWTYGNATWMPQALNQDGFITDTYPDSVTQRILGGPNLGDYISGNSVKPIDFNGFWVDEILSIIQNTTKVNLTSYQNSTPFYSDATAFNLNRGGQAYMGTLFPEYFDNFGVFADYTNPRSSLGSNMLFSSAGTEESSNTAPVVNINAILPTTAYSNNDLNCSFIATDADGDALSANVSWWKGSDVFYSLNQSVTNGTQYSVYLSSGNTSVGETWNCSVAAYDGTAYDYNSTTKTISNGVISTVLMYPITNVSVKNGTYILNVQGRKYCNVGDCVNVGQYFGIGE